MSTLKEYQPYAGIIIACVVIAGLIFIFSTGESYLSEILDTPLTEIKFWHFILGLLWVGFMTR